MPVRLSPVAPPAPPASYTAPSPTGVVVTNYAELAAEMALSGPRVIVVADGVYEGSGLTTNQGHELWAENMGQAVLHFGIGFRGNGGNTGGALHGFVFDVDDLANVDSSAVLNEAIVNTWDALTPFEVGSGVVVEDCTFNGNDVIGAAVQAAMPGGLTVRRCTMTNFIDVGVSAFRNGSGENDFDRITLEDLDISNISRPVPGSASGVSAEIAIYIGHRFDIARVRIRDCAWAGIGLVNEVQDWTISDVDIDRVGWGLFENGSVGIYCEECNNGTIQRVLMGPNMKVGINCEWNSLASDPYTDSMEPRNHDITITDSTLQAYKVGVHFDVSVSNCVVTKCVFERAWMAGVLDNNRFPTDLGTYPLSPGGLILESSNTVDEESCEFRLDEGIAHVAHHHHGGSALQPPDGWVLDPDEYVYAPANPTRSNRRRVFFAVKDTIEVT